jgi:hypothetical protein
MPSQPPRPAQAPQLEQTIAGIHFIAQKCERMGTQALQCFVTAEALEKDGLLCVGGYVIDSKGIRKDPTGVTIGGGSGGHTAQTNIVENVPVSIVFQFPGVDPDVTGIPRLMLGLHRDCSYAQSFGTPEFRNVPLTGN